MFSRLCETARNSPGFLSSLIGPRRKTGSSDWILSFLLCNHDWQIQREKWQSVCWIALYFLWILSFQVLLPQQFLYDLIWTNFFLVFYLPLLVTLGGELPCCNITSITLISLIKQNKKQNSIGKSLSFISP